MSCWCIEKLNLIKNGDFMSRYACSISKNNGLVDDNCTVGYDEPMETYFFQTGAEDENGRPIIWLGTRHREFSTLDDLVTKLSGLGYSFDMDKSDVEKLLSA